MPTKESSDVNRALLLTVAWDVISRKDRLAPTLLREKYGNLLRPKLDLSCMELERPTRLRINIEQKRAWLFKMIRNGRNTSV